MALFQEMITLQKEITLATANPTAKPATKISSGYDGSRVKMSELENAYLYDPLVFNSVNKSVQTIMAAGYEIKAGTEAEKKKVEDFLNSLGDIMGDATFEEILTLTFQNQIIFGRSYIENVYNKQLTKLLDLISLDPKQIDYARDMEGNILFDKNGNPIGYVQKVGYGVNTKGLGDETPKGFDVDSDEIFVKRERIVHFKLYPFSNGYESIGGIEPAYKSIVRKHKIEEAQTNSIYSRGTYPLIDYVGNDTVYPTPDMLDKASENLSKIQHNRYIAVPHWHEIKPLEVKQSEIVDDTLKMLRENLGASLGMPMAFITGSGEATNRATLTNQQKFLEFTLNDIVKRTLSYFKKYVFKKMAELEKFSEVPEIVWGDIGAEDKDDKAKRLQSYTHKNVAILKPSDVRDFAIKSEGLDLYDRGKEEDVDEETEDRPEKEDKE